MKTRKNDGAVVEEEKVVQKKKKKHRKHENVVTDDDQSKIMVTKNFTKKEQKQRNSEKESYHSSKEFDATESAEIENGSTVQRDGKKEKHKNHNNLGASNTPVSQFCVINIKKEEVNDSEFDGMQHEDREDVVYQVRKKKKKNHRNSPADRVENEIEDEAVNYVIERKRSKKHKKANKDSNNHEGNYRTYNVKKEITDCDELLSEQNETTNHFDSTISKKKKKKKRKSSERVNSPQNKGEDDKSIDYTEIPFLQRDKKSDIHFTNRAKKKKKRKLHQEETNFHSIVKEEFTSHHKNVPMQADKTIVDVDKNEKRRKRKHEKSNEDLSFKTIGAESSTNVKEQRTDRDNMMVADIRSCVDDDHGVKKKKKKKKRMYEESQIKSEAVNTTKKKKKADSREGELSLSKSDLNKSASCVSQRSELLESKRKRRINDDNDEFNGKASKVRKGCKDRDERSKVGNNIRQEKNKKEENKIFAVMNKSGVASTSLPRFEATEFHLKWQFSAKDKEEMNRQGIKFETGTWRNEEFKKLEDNFQKLLEQSGMEQGELMKLINDRSNEARMKRKDLDLYPVLVDGINRPVRLIYLKLKKLCNPDHFKGDWTEEEVETLFKLHRQHGNKWTLIGEMLGRSRQSVAHKIQRMVCGSVTKDAPKVENTSKWTKDEVDRLLQALPKEAGLNDGKKMEIDSKEINWNKVSEMVKTRSSESCRAKWVYFLSWRPHDSSKKIWTKKEYNTFIEALSKCGKKHEKDVDWSRMLTDFDLPGTVPVIRRQWKQLRLRIPMYHQMDFQQQVDWLSHNYISGIHKKKLVCTSDLNSK